MYDLLIVGAGLTAATLVAALRERLKICVMDIRGHIGGNCFDEEDRGTRVHRYGPHIFHCPSARIVQFLSRFTEWVPYEHKVTAEIEWEVMGGTPALRYVPFPYCRETVRALGRELSEEEILRACFYGYSRKMWGMAWEELPASVRGRVPRELTERPCYYRHPFVALPKHGYTRMLENMLDGAEMILNVGPEEWTGVAARAVVYTGRPDLMPLPREGVTIGERYRVELGFRTLEIGFKEERIGPEWGDAVCLHACSMKRAWTRKTAFARMMGGHKRVVSTEMPREARRAELVPFYPVETVENRQRYGRLAELVRGAYPNVTLAGRLGAYRYFDMYQAVGQALAVGAKLFAGVEREMEVAGV